MSRSVSFLKYLDLTFIHILRLDLQFAVSFCFFARDSNPVKVKPGRLEHPRALQVGYSTGVRGHASPGRILSYAPLRCHFTLVSRPKLPQAHAQDVKKVENDRESIEKRQKNRAKNTR